MAILRIVDGISSEQFQIGMATMCEHIRELRKKIKVRTTKTMTFEHFDDVLPSHVNLTAEEIDENQN